MDIDNSSVGNSNLATPKGMFLRGWMLRTFRWENSFLIIALFLGFFLRLIPILWGIPFEPYIQNCHPDEFKVFNSILNFPEIYWTTKPFAGYGTAVQYILGVFLYPVKWIFLSFPNLRNEYVIFAWIASRLASVFLGTGCIYVTFLIAKRIYDEKVALLSSAFLSLAFYHTLNSALITLDVSSSFILMLNFLLCFRAVETNRWRDYILLGIASGLLIGTKTVLGIFFCIPFILNFLNFYSPQTNNKKGQQRFPSQMKYLASYVVVAGGVFILFHPHIFLDMEQYISFYLREKHDWIDRSRGPINQLFHIWGKNTISAVGLFVPVFALIGAVVMGRKNLRLKSMMIIFVLLYYGFWRWFLSPRYVIVVTPILCIFAANACVFFFNHKISILKPIGIAMASVALIHSFYWCAAGISLRLNDTRHSSGKFIMQNIPAGTTIGLSGVSERYDWRTHSWNYPKISFKKYRVVNFLNNPEVFILNSDDAEKILNTLNSGKLQKNYVLPEVHYKDWYRYSAPSPKIFKFYDDFLIKKKSGYKLMKKFSRNVTVPLEFAPPAIEIYKKN